MRLPVATSFYEVIVAVHVMAVVIAFGVTFAYPVIFAVGARTDPRALPLLHRIEYTIERWLINPGLLLVVVAGIYLASDRHVWSEFFVQWGLGASVVIGALSGALLLRTNEFAGLHPVGRRRGFGYDAASWLEALEIPQSERPREAQRLNRLGFQGGIQERLRPIKRSTAEEAISLVEKFPSNSAA